MFYHIDINNNTNNGTYNYYDEIVNYLDNKLHGYVHLFNVNGYGHII